MIKLENTQVFNFEGAIRGMRNPMNSWDKSDSGFVLQNVYDYELGYEAIYEFVIGENDLKLMKKLVKSGTDHRKFLRQIMVSVDITAPLYWWKEYDTYKVATVSNSCSTMHKITTKEIVMADFSFDNSNEDINLKELLDTYSFSVVKDCEALRKKYLETKNKVYWRALIQLLPNSYNQLRTCTMNYEVLINQYFARRNHKLDEWHDYCKWIESLPYMEELISVMEDK